MEYTTPSSFDNVTTVMNDTRSTVDCDFTRAEFVGYFLVQPIICIVGFILNLVNVFVFLRGKQFSGSSTYRLMMILSVFDALTLLLTFPQSFVRCKNYLALCGSVNFKNFRYAIFRWQVYAGHSLINTSEGISCWMTVLLSVERYISIKHHYIIKAHFSTSNVHKLIAVIVLICVIINAPLCFAQILIPFYKNATIEGNVTANMNQTETVFSGYLGTLSAFGRSKYYETYSWLRVIIFNFVPLIFLSLVNAFLIYIVRSSNHFRKHSSQTRSGEKRMKAQRNLTILLVTVIFLFLTGQIPLSFAHAKLFTVLSNCPFRSPGCCIFYKHYRMVCSMMCLITYATNFFIYQTLNKHFRAEIYRLCRLFQVRSGRQSGPTTEVVGGEAVELVTRRNNNQNHEMEKSDVQHLSVGNGELELPSESETRITPDTNNE